ncbi:MAG: hypothetical protein U0163_08735 [Gemmatimonadaceae bacterium]
MASLSESHAYARIVADLKVRTNSVQSIMQQAFLVDIETPVQLLVSMITAQNPAVLVRDFADKTYVLTGTTSCRRCRRPGVHNRHRRTVAPFVGRSDFGRSTSLNCGPSTSSCWHGGAAGRFSNTRRPMISSP